MNKINALGVLTFDRKLAAKESGRVVARSLRYYAVIWERGIVLGSGVRTAITVR